MKHVSALAKLAKRSQGRFDELITCVNGPACTQIAFVAVCTATPIAIVTLLGYAFGQLQFLTVDQLIHPWPIPDAPAAAFALGLLDAVLFSPSIETALTFVPIWALRRLRAAESLIPVFAAILWGLVHSRGGNWSQMVQVWPFYCFTVVLLKFEKVSPNTGWARASLVHSAHNLIGLLWGLPLALFCD